MLLALGSTYRRLLAALLGIIGPKAAYRLMGWGAQLIYRLLDPLRMRCEAQCRAALAGRVPDDQIPALAKQSFVHRVWNLTDLLLAPRLLRSGSFHRFGGRIPECHLLRLRKALADAQPVIFVTAYYGSFDLLPIFLGYNGIPETVVYLPHGNAAFDDFRRRVRGQSGCELVSVEEASRLGDVLARGGAVGLVADHHVDLRGMPVTFLGIQTQALRSVGLLAWRYQADVVVAGIRRVNHQFHFEIDVADVIDHSEIVDRQDPVAFVTDRYLRALEKMILQEPAQYLWGHARWGEKYASKITEAYARDLGAGQDPLSVPTPKPDRQDVAQAESSSTGTLAAGP